jgi:hypothetical protein
MFAWLSQVLRNGARPRSSLEESAQLSLAATFLDTTQRVLLAHRVSAATNGTCAHMDQSLSYVALRDGGMAVSSIARHMLNSSC